MSKETKVDKAIIALNAIAKLSELKDPRNALSTGSVSYTHLTLPTSFLV